VLARNDRRFGAEFDFLCARGVPDEFFIFEIKKKPRLRSAAYPRISAAQLKRLRKAALKMQIATDKFLTVRISLLVVDKKSGEIEMIADI
jgi:hypothetical protein